MTGYSGTPLWKKLGLKPGASAAVVDPPEGYHEFLLEGAPDVVWGEIRPDLALVHLFVTDRAALDAALPSSLAAIRPDGRIWVSWPKKSAKVPTDLTEDRLRDAALPLGLVDIKVCAVDATWSGLCFVIRKDLRPAT